MAGDDQLDGGDAAVSDTDVAIVGMAGRFPGADDVDQLWQRVARGDDCLVDLDNGELLRAGVPRSTVRDPNYVKRSGMLADVAGFDARFFGIGDRDAALMDPQHRHFLECAWEALESAAHVPERFGGAIGVFAGCGMNTYLLNNLITNPQLIDDLGWFLVRHTGNDKDFLPTFVAYKLDLRGPAISVQTACSTSLVAIHLAVQSLLAFECDLALAGGSTIEVPHGVGYHYREGEILAPDGRCRAFDAASHGTVLTSGTGVVALRRLTDALDDGDPVLAVIKGSAVNNDGSRKVGFLAPSVDGHADVVKEALAVAGLSARDIGMLEAHGTGTAVGDPIEVAALTEAFRATTDDTGFCRLGSTKPNIGHLDTAAGVASVVKAVQALRHRTLPPLANHTGPSPLLNLDRTPFTLSGEAAEWVADGRRRAGVSSLGVGGTNAHVVLEEAPALQPTPTALPEQVLCLSGMDANSVQAAAARLAGAIDAGTNLADVAHTLSRGRRAMPRRRVVVAPDGAQAPSVLAANDPRRSFEAAGAEARPSLIFMFPGGGSQYPGMGAALDERFTEYHRVLAEGIEIVQRLGGPDLAPLLAPDGDEETLRQAAASLPAVFVVSVALARQWMHWGAHPDALAGHSLGEYVAAYLAGVMSLEDAIRLVVTRSRLMAQATSNGAMLVVSLGEDEVRATLPSELSLAVINAADECVVAGPAPAVREYAARLDEQEIVNRLIPLAAAAHSSLLDPVLDEFRATVRTVELAPPTLRYLSNLTGTWITAEQATDPDYWVDHLRNTVRFADCLATALAEGPAVVVELGPGHALSSYARRQQPAPAGVVATLRHANDTTPDSAFTLLAFAKLWALGCNVDVGQLAGADRRRLRLPTYPFQHTTHWIDPGAGISRNPAAVRTPSTNAHRLRRVNDLDQWFWSQEWVAATGGPALPDSSTANWLIVAEADDELAVAIASAICTAGGTATIVADVTTAAFDDVDGVAVIGLARADLTGTADAAERWLTRGLHAIRALGARPSRTTFAAITIQAMPVAAVAERPVDAIALGPVLVAPQEYPSMRGVLVDIDRPIDPTAMATSIAAELLAGTDALVAYRGGQRRVAELRPVRLEAIEHAPIADHSTFLVTGGLGEIGSALAGHLAADYGANLVVLSSAALPPPHERQQWVAAHGPADPTSRRLAHLAELEGLGTKVAVVVADLTAPGAASAALEEAERLVGPIDGVIHAAGALHDGLIELADPADHGRVLGPKADAAAALLAALGDRPTPSVLCLVGSTSTVIGAQGQSAYVAANAYLDALAGERGNVRVVTIDYGAFAGHGMAAESAARMRLRLGAGDSVQHPVLTSLTRHADGSIIVTGELDPAWHWLVDEHRTSAGLAILPGTGHLELMLASLTCAGLPPALADVALVQPLVVPDEHAARVRVVIGPPAADGDRAVQVESDGGRGLSWRLHSEARLRDTPVAEPAAFPELAPAAPAGADPLTGQREHLLLGERWNGVETSSTTEGRASATVHQPVGDVGLWRAHPAIVDLATAVALSLFEREPGRLFVPVGYDAVTSRASLPERVLVSATPSASPTPGTVRADVVVADPDDRSIVLELRGLTLRSVDPAGFGDLADIDDDDLAEPDDAGPFVALAEGLGIRRHDAPAVFDRVMASGRHRVIASSVPLPDLIAAAQRVDEEPGSPADVVTAGGVIGVITHIWQELLGVADISPDADFFDLGGHSLIAIRVMARIQRDLGVKLPLSELFGAPTVRALAAVAEANGAVAPHATTDGEAPVRAEGSQAPERAVHKCVVPLREEGDQTPLFIVHGAGGNVLFLSSLLRAMDAGRPVYGLQALGIDSHDLPDTTVEAMAARYAAEIRAFRPGPYLLGGYSGGGLVSLELADRLQAAGEEVRGVVMFDSVPPGKAFPGRAARLRNLATNAVRDLEAMRPYAKHSAKAWRDRLRGRGAERSDQAEFGFSSLADLGYVDLYHYFTAASEKYRPHHYDVDVVLVKAGVVWPTQPADYYWGQHIGGELIVTTSPGDHHSMFLPENAPALAAAIQPLLARLDRPRG